MIAQIKTGNTLTLMIKGESKPRILQVNNRTVEILQRINDINTATKTDQHLANILLEEFLIFIAPIKFLTTKDGRFVIGDDHRLYLTENKSRPIFGYLSSKLMEFMEENIPLDYLVEFWKNCMLNPDQAAIDELFEFLEANNYPITFDGYFIGYKKVTSFKENTYNSEFDGLRLDSKNNVRGPKGHFVGNPLRQKYIDYLENNLEAQFVDSHSKQIKQSIGDTVSMDRTLCDTDRNRTCSTGLHVGSYAYSKSFSGDNFIYVKVNPMHVTAVPKEYGNGKLRCCEYTIVGFAEESELDVKIFD